MRYKYKAILNQYNVCVAMHHNTPMVKGIEVNENKVGMRYIHSTGEWKQAELPEQTEPVYEPTNAEIYEKLLITEENQAIIMLALAEIYETQIE